MNTYAVVMEKDEDGWWIASIPAVAGVHTQGSTPDEAMTRIREALALAIGDDEAASAKLEQYRKVG